MMSRTPSTAQKQPETGGRRRAWLVRKVHLAQAVVAVETARLDRWDLLVLPAKMASKGLKAHPAHKAFKALQVPLELLELQASKDQQVRQDSTVKTVRMASMVCPARSVRRDRPEPLAAKAFPALLDQQAQTVKTGKTAFPGLWARSALKVRKAILDRPDPPALREYQAHLAPPE